MDHLTLTLIIGAVELIVIPWSAWITLRYFELSAKVSVLQNQMENEIKLQKVLNSAINKSLTELESDLADVKRQINTGFKDVMEALKK